MFSNNIPIPHGDLSLALPVPSISVTMVNDLDHPGRDGMAAGPFGLKSIRDIEHVHVPAKGNNAKHVPPKIHISRPLPTPVARDAVLEQEVVIPSSEWFDHDSPSDESSSSDSEDDSEEEVIKKTSLPVVEPLRLKAAPITAQQPTISIISLPQLPASAFNAKQTFLRHPHSPRLSSPLSPRIPIPPAPAARAKVAAPAPAPVPSPKLLSPNPRGRRVGMLGMPPKSPFSPLRHSFVPQEVDDDDEEEEEECELELELDLDSEPEEQEPVQVQPRQQEVSPISAKSNSPTSVLPEDKKGLPRARFEGILKSSRERKERRDREEREAREAAAAAAGVVLSHSIPSAPAPALAAAGLASSPAPSPRSAKPTPPPMRIQTTGLSLNLNLMALAVGAGLGMVPPPLKSAGGKKTGDLRRDVFFKAHEERQRQSFLSRLLATPSSSPTTLTTPVTPPDSPAEFHYTLPSPGLVSPLACFENLNNALSPGNSSVEGWGEWDRVETVNWAKEAAATSGETAPEDDEDDWSSPPARVEEVLGGLAALQQQIHKPRLAPITSPTSTSPVSASPQKQKHNHLPIGMVNGKVAIPIPTLPHTPSRTRLRTPMHMNAPATSALTPATLGRTPVTAALPMGREVVPPRRGASLMRNAHLHQNAIPPRTASNLQQSSPLATTPKTSLPAPPRQHTRPAPLALAIPARSSNNTAAAPTPAAVTRANTMNQRNRMSNGALPSLMEISERLAAKSPTVPSPVSRFPAKEDAVASKRRAAAFPGFLRQAAPVKPIVAKEQDEPAIPAIVLTSPMSPLSPLSPSSKVSAGYALQRLANAPAPSKTSTGPKDPVLTLPPARPKSVEIEVERKQRGSAMVARLAHRRNSSDSAKEALDMAKKVELKEDNVRSPAYGWF
ncbi:hypothetical protein DL93DRAFT_2099136 [Clavulina sp. PMI_390]|nr:hypothetical protein DL93DRAFT_2099136 [Clavulina sp. PMI_390]